MEIYREKSLKVFFFVSCIIFNWQSIIAPSLVHCVYVETGYVTLIQAWKNRTDSEPI